MNNYGIHEDEKTKFTREEFKEWFRELNKECRMIFMLRFSMNELLTLMYFVELCRKNVLYNIEKLCYILREYLVCITS